MAYTIAGLENGIQGCKKNIAVLEAAIEKERNTIKEYRIMIDDIERAERKKTEALKNVKIEIDDGRKD